MSQAMLAPTRPSSAYDPAAVIGPLDQPARKAVEQASRSSTGSPFEHDCTEIICQKLLSAGGSSRTAGEVWETLARRQGLADREPVIYTLYRGIFAAAWFDVAMLIEAGV